MDNELYQAVLLQHAKRPKNFGPMEHPTHAAEGHNALCGDEISLALTMENGVVREVKFTGSACAICMASASMMTGEIGGMTSAEAKKLAASFRSLAISGTIQDLPKSLQILGGVHQYPQRVKCAILPWETLVAALGSPVG